MTIIVANNCIQIQQKDGDDDTPLLCASGGGATGHKEIVRLFIKKKANIEAQNKEGLTPLGRAAKAGEIEVAEILVEEGAKLEKV